MRSIARLLLVVALEFVIGTVAWPYYFFTSRIWTGGSGVDDKWTTTTNWSPNGFAAGDNLTFDGTCGATCNSTADTASAMGLVTFTSAYTGVTTLSHNLEVLALNLDGTLPANTLTATGYSIKFNGGGAAGYLTCGGNFNTLTNVSSASVQANGGGTFTLNSGCTLTAHWASDAFVNHGTFTETGNATASGYGPLTTDGSYTQTGGTMRYLNRLTWTAGTVSLSGVAVTFDSGSGVAGSLTCPGDFNALTSVSSVTITGAAGFTLNTGCTLTGHWNADALTVHGTFTETSNAVNNGYGVLTNDGTFTQTGGNMRYLNGLSWTAGTVSLSGVALTFDVTSVSRSITCPGNFNSLSSVSSVSIQGGGGTFTVNSGCQLSGHLLSNNMNLTISGTFTETGSGTAQTYTINNGGVLNGGTYEVNANWTNNGTFNPNGHGVTFTNAAHSISGNTGFYDLTMSASGTAKTITFAAGSTQTVTHTWSANGASGALLTFVSSSTPTQWNVNAASGCSLSYLSVKDSKAMGPINGGATSSGVSGNTNWTFTDTSACTLAAGRMRRFIGD